MAKRVKVLLVEDDKLIAKVVKRYLEIRSYDVTYCDNGQTGLEIFRTNKQDICLLDVMVPGKDGFQLAQEIRQIDQFVPILFMSSKGMAEDRIRAFRLGADDYITKPLNNEELFLRMEAVLKRQHHQPKVSQLVENIPSVMQVGRYTFDFPFQKLLLNGEERRLTTREAELLRFLYLNRNQLIRRELILQEIWGDDDYYKGRSLDVFMSRLRRYLKEDPNIEIINVHATGFKFVVAEA